VLDVAVIGNQVVVVVGDILLEIAALDQTLSFGCKEQTVWVGSAAVAAERKLGPEGWRHWCFCMTDLSWVCNCCTPCCSHLGSEHKSDFSTLIILPPLGFGILHLQRQSEHASAALGGVCQFYN